MGVTCAAIRPLDAITASDAARPLTGVPAMGGMSNVLRTGDPGVRRLVAAGDALCHTNPSYAFGLSFALAHAQARAAATQEDPEALADAYREEVAPEARERHGFACETGAARVRAWRGERLDVGRRDGCYPLFAFGAALAAAARRSRAAADDRPDRAARPHVRFDDDGELHGRIERIYGELTARPAARTGPPRDELLALATSACAARAGSSPVRRC